MDLERTLPSSNLAVLYNQLINSQFNWILLVLIGIAVYNIYSYEHPDAQVSEPKIPEVVLFKRYTPTGLQPYNGEEGQPIYMGVRGKIFDVTPGRSFYGPGGPYENFAGRDASRGLALNSFDAEVLTPLDQPIDKLDNLSSEEIDSLNDWESHFQNKYLIVGELYDPLAKQ